MNKDTHIEEKIWNYFNNIASDDDLRKITQWLDQSKMNLKTFATLKKAYIEMEANASSDESQTCRAFDRILNSIERVENNRKIENSNHILYRRKAILQYAAAVFLSLILGFSAYFIGDRYLSNSTSGLCEIEVPYGGKSTLVLPDGSKIWLNAGSKLKYNKDFGEKTREIYIEGEAYFDVEKYKYPFVVHTSHFDINVLGTTFNVKSYPEEENIETTLVEGNIRIESKESRGILFMKPNQKMIFHKPSSSISQSYAYSKEKEKVADPVQVEKQEIVKKKIAIENNVNVEEATSWKDGKLLFNNQPLWELTKLLERKYDIEFEFKDKSLKEYSYSGTLRDFPLEQVLMALELTSPVKYTIEEKKVFLSINKKLVPHN